MGPLARGGDVAGAASGAARRPPCGQDAGVRGAGVAPDVRGAGVAGAARERRVVGRVTTALAWAREATAAGALLVPADAPWTQAAVVQQRHRERLGLAGRCEHLGDGPEVEGRLMLVDRGGAAGGVPGYFILPHCARPRLPTHGDAVGGHGSSVYPRPGVVIRRAGLAGSTSSLRRSWAA